MVKKAEVVDEEIKSARRIIAEINKTYGKNSIGFANELDLDIKRISTGITRLDEALLGGLPLGRTVELFGGYSAGKSLISLLTIASAQKEGLETAYIDVEGSFDPEFAKSLGVDPTKLIVANLVIGEHIFEAILQLLQRNLGVIVVDSVAAMVTTAEESENFEKAHMAVKARLMSKSLPKLNAHNKDTLIIFINQVRETLAMWGPTTTTPGGHALEYFSSVRLEVKRGDSLGEDGEKAKSIQHNGVKSTPVFGQIVQYRVEKNKAGGNPKKEGSFKFIYDGYRIEE